MIRPTEIENLPRDPDLLLEVIRGLCTENDGQRTNIIDLTTQIETYRKENSWLREVLAARNRRLFGRKSEKLSSEELAGWLFNEVELAAGAAPPVSGKETDEKITYTVTRRKRGRKPIADNLPRTIIEHDLSPEEKTCAACGAGRPRLGPDISEEIEYIPARVSVNRHVYHQYGPCDCGRGDGKIVAFKREPRVLPGSMAAPSLLSFLATSKFCDGLPFYRVEKMFARLGVEYSRATMANQMIGVSRALQPLLDLMWKDLLSGPVIRMDETKLQVLHEPGRAADQMSWMHVAVGGTRDNRIVLYHYHASRKHEIPVKILEGWQGYLQTDGLAAYHGAGEKPGVIPVGCWGHVRRKFIDARGGPKAPPGGLADEALAKIGRLYRIEKELRERCLWNLAFVEERRAQAAPVLEELKTWLDADLPRVEGGSLLFEAMRYLRNEWDKLIRYLDQAELTPDNNITENFIRYFVIGRKNWLFANTPLGAHSSAALYSVIVSAEANGLEPYAYMHYVLTVLPATTKEKLSDLLPHRIDPALLKNR
jgi:transposase